MLTETTGKTSAQISIANNNGRAGDEPRAMDTELVARGIRATEIALDELERIFRRDVDNVRNQLAQLRTSVELGSPTDFVRLFGLARQIANGASPSKIADKLANDLVYAEPCYAHALELSVWPLLGIAAGVAQDVEYELKAHIRQWCHGGSIALDEETERAMFDAVGLTYKRARVTARILPDVYLDEADDDEMLCAG